MALVLKGFSAQKVLLRYPFILILVSSLLFGSFLDNYNPEIQAIFDGSLTFGQPFSGFYFVGFLFVDEIISVAYKLFPELPWYLLFLKLISFFGIFLFFEVLSQVIKINNQVWKYLIINLILISILLSNLVYLDVTFWSVLSIGLIPIYFFVKKTKNKKADFLIVLIGLLLCLTRFDTAFLTYIFIGVVLLVLDKKLALKAIKRSFPILVILIIISTFHFSNNYFKSQYVFKSSSIDLYMVSDGGFRVPIESYSTEEDKIKYKAVVNHFFNDHNNITPEFISSMILNPFKGKFLENFINGPIYILKQKSKKIFTKYPGEIISIILLLFILGINRRLVLILFLYISLYLGLGLIAKVEARFVLPIFYCFLPIFLFFQPPIKNLKATSSILFFFSIISFFILFKKVDDTILLQTQNSISTNQIKALTEKGVVFLDNKSAKLLNTGGKLIQKPVNFLTVDLSEFPLWPKYQVFLKQNCNCNTLEIISFFNDSSVFGKQSYYCTSPEKMDFIKKYLNLIYKFELKTSIKAENISPNYNLNLYKIE